MDDIFHQFPSRLRSTEPTIVLIAIVPAGKICSHFYLGISKAAEKGIGLNKNTTMHSAATIYSDEMMRGSV
jgi:hypothetical protein